MEVCDQWDDCLDSKVIDNFAGSSCDVVGRSIPEIVNRSGGWFTFSSADITPSFGVGDPGAEWADMACGAWTTGGIQSFKATDYAGMGVSLNNGSAYSLEGYTGVSVQMESANPVILFVQTSNHYEFMTTLSGGIGVLTYNIPFGTLVPFINASTPSGAILDLTQVTYIEFQATSLASFGFAVHLVSLY